MVLIVSKANNKVHEVVLIASEANNKVHEVVLIASEANNKVHEVVLIASKANNKVLRSRFLSFNVIIKNKVLNYFLTNKVSLEITRGFYF